MKLRYLSTLAASVCLITFTSCDKAKETAAKAEEKAKEAAEKVSDKAKETAVKVEEKAKEAAEKVSEKAKETVAAVKEKTKEIVEEAKEKINGGAPATAEYPAADKAAFTAALEPIKKMHEEMMAAGANGEPPFDKMSEIIAALKAIPTNGMPAELKTALTAANEKAEELIGTLKPLAADPSAATPEVQAKIGELMTEGKTLGEKAIEMAAKYGVDMSFMK